jgi:hypothetical protein
MGASPHERPRTGFYLDGLNPGLLTHAQLSPKCSGVLDAVAEDQLGAGVDGVGGVEVGTQSSDGLGAAESGERVDPHVEFVADVPNRNFAVRAPDPHGFDGDRDGVGCET